MSAAPPDTTGPALDVRGLTKTYRTGLFRKKTRAALKGLDLTVRRGEILGYLGPNGSGKTTTLKILMGLIYPDAGSATILGSPLRDGAWRHRVGYLPEQPYLYDYLTRAGVPRLRRPPLRDDRRRVGASGRDGSWSWSDCGARPTCPCGGSRRG